MHDPGHDPRLTPARADLAAKYLEGKVQAERFVTGEEFEVTDAIAAVREQPSPGAPRPLRVGHGRRGQLAAHERARGRRRDQERRRQRGRPRPGHERRHRGEHGHQVEGEGAQESEAGRGIFGRRHERASRRSSRTSVAGRSSSAASTVPATPRSRRKDRRARLRALMISTEAARRPVSGCTR